MQGSSRAAAAAGQEALLEALQPGTDTNALAEDLFGMTSALDSSATLRRAFADPSRDAEAKRGLVDALFGGKVSESATGLLKTLVTQRWSTERDLSDTLESLAVQSLLVGAERAGRADAVEDELFRFERIVANSPALRDTLGSRNTDGPGKAALVTGLLEGKASPETIRLAAQAVRVPRGRRLDRTLEAYLDLAARRREELTAVVIAAVALSGTQQARLKSSLEAIYGKRVQLQVVQDPAVMGGIRVQVGDEVVDGTVLRRLEEARRHLAGG
jgi:F-type H+-transporting ATPase subunit delta